MDLSDREATQMMQESAPDLVQTLRTLVQAGESIEKLEQWVRTYANHKFHSKTIGDVFVQVIHHLVKTQ